MRAQISLHMLSRKLFANVNTQFANESDGYKATSAPSAFGLPAEGALRSGQEPTPELSERHYSKLETAIKKSYLTTEQPDVAAVIDEVQLKCFNAKTETSSAADPATDFVHSQIICFRSHSICAE